MLTTVIQDSTLCLAGAAESPVDGKTNIIVPASLSSLLTLLCDWASACSLWTCCRFICSIFSVKLSLPTPPFLCYCLVLFDTNVIFFSPPSLNSIYYFLLPHQPHFFLSLSSYHITGGLMCLTWIFSASSPLTQPDLCKNILAYGVTPVDFSLISILFLHLPRSCSPLSGCCLQTINTALTLKVWRTQFCQYVLPT